MHRRGFLRGIAAAAVQLALPSPKIAGLLVGEVTAQRWVWVQPMERLEAAIVSAQEAYTQFINVTVHVIGNPTAYAIRVVTGEPGEQLGDEAG